MEPIATNWSIRRGSGGHPRATGGLRHDFAVAMAILLGLFFICAPARAQEEPEWEEWKVREDHHVWLKGADKPLIGTVEETDDPKKILFRARGSTMTVELKMEDIDRIEDPELPWEVYKEKKERVAAGDLEGHAQLAWNCQRHGDEKMVGAAIEEWKEVLRIRPNYKWAYRYLVDIYIEKEERATEEFPADLAEEEVAFWMKAEANGVKDPRALFRFGRICRKLGILRRAGRLFEDAIDANKEEGLPGVDNDALLEMASILREMGRYGDAAETYRELIDSEDLNERMAFLAQTGLGMALVGAGDLEGAAAAFQAGSDLQPENPEPKELLGSVEYSRDALEEAERLYGEARELHGAAPPARLLVNQALTRTRLGRFSAADEDLAEAERAEPSLGGIYFVRAYLRLCQGDAEAAIGELDRGGDVSPDDPYAAYLRGIALRGSGKGEEALVALRSALTGGFDAALSLRAMAETHAALGNTEEAVRYFEYAFAGESASAEEQTRLAVALMAADMHEDALAAIEAAVGADPEFVPAILVQGFLLYRSGKFSSSREAFEAALRLRQGDPYAQVALEKVKELADLQVWTEPFDRENGDKVRNRWEESERVGIEIGIRDGTCVFRGTQSGDGRTLLTRTIPKGDTRRFVRVEVDMDPAKADTARTGIRLEVGQSGRIVVFVEGGRLQYAYQAKRTGDSKWETGEVAEWPEGRHALGVGIADRRSWRFHIFLDGEIVGELKRVSLMNFKGKEIELVVYGEAKEGTAWEMGVEEVRIYRRGSAAPEEEAPP